jgi:hypothetical protein
MAASDILKNIYIELNLTQMITEPTHEVSENVKDRNVAWAKAD